MTNKLETFCKKFQEMQKHDTILTYPSREFIIKNQALIRSRFSDILNFFCSTSKAITENNYSSLHRLAAILISDDNAAALSEKPSIPNKSSEMMFFYEFILEWDDLFRREIKFSEWEDICAEGLQLLMTFINNPKRQKNFLCDDEFDAFKDKFSLIAQRILEKHGIGVDNF